MMKDQAWKLRDLVPDAEIFPQIDGQLRGKRLAITSGKGGVGKSVISVNLALLMARQGYNTLLIDGDVSLSKLPILTDSAPEYSFADVRQGKKDLEEIVFEYRPNCSILPTGSSILDLVDSQEDFTYRLRHQFEKLDGRYDYMLIDTASGISSLVFGELASSDEVAVVTTPEPTAVADAYAVVKILTFFYPRIPVHLIFNFVESEEEAFEAYKKFNLITEQFLKRQINYLGFLFYDEHVKESVMRQTPMALWEFHPPFIEQLEKIMSRWLEESYRDLSSAAEIRN